MSKWIRKGDRVLVLSGNDKGKAGEILARVEERVIVQGINVRKKHLRRTSQTQGGRIVEMEMPIHVSNVMLCDKEDRPFRVRVKGDNLVYTREGKETIHRSTRKPT